MTRPPRTTRGPGAPPRAPFAPERRASFIAGRAGSAAYPVLPGVRGRDTCGFAARARATTHGPHPDGIPRRGAGRGGAGSEPAAGAPHTHRAHRTARTKETTP
ncbi:hypothetical protein GCM10010331_73240 [Streptomyces xanthochromogenes]|nr:hypothetical protein GCM10010331_73240 [Streptomyces xanthochromogenes]